ncbi:MAG TPA: hypothetical protein VIV61_15915 [Candidatus Ozemobacteraceae bacterium]
MRIPRISTLFLALMLLIGIGCPALPAAQTVDVSDLADDIPEPTGASQELPSPIPMIYEFVGGMMAGEHDRCLANFDVSTFMTLLFGKPLKMMSPSEFSELYAYQIQSQRNEFRFLAKVMFRIGKDAKINYSNPRFHGKSQCKVNVKMKTTKGTFDFTVYCRYIEERWIVYDYALNDQRYSDSFKAAIAKIKIDDYVRMLRPFYDEEIRYRQIKNDEYGISLKVPDYLTIREKVSPALLYSISGMNGQMLIHVQAANYSRPQTLKQVAIEIKRSLMPFKPRLYDQWKTDIAGVDIGHVLFRFEKNGKILYTHMIIIPMGQKLVVLNFYHSSLQLMKHYSTIRDKIFESFRLPKIEAMGGDLSIPSDDTALPTANRTPSELPPYGEQTPANPPVEEIPPPPPGEEGVLTPDTGLPPSDEAPPPPPADDENGELPPPPPDEETGAVPPPPPADDAASETPTPPADNGNGEVPPPPPADGEDTSGDSQNPADLHGEDQAPPPPPPDDSGEVPPPPPDDGGSSDVTF